MNRDTITAEEYQDWITRIVRKIKTPKNLRHIYYFAARIYSKED